MFKIDYKITVNKFNGEQSIHDIGDFPIYEKPIDLKWEKIQNDRYNRLLS